MKRPVFVVLACLALAVWGVRALTGPSALPVETLRLAVSPQIMSALVFIAADKGFFRAEGLDVTLESFPFGKDALAKVIEGQADVATVAEVPVMWALLKGSRASVFSTIQATDHDITVIARKDAGIRSPADLAGKRVGLVRGTNHEYFLDLFLGVNKIDPAGITYVPVSMDDGAEALISGRIDALASWVSARLIVQRAMPDGTISFPSDGIYTELWTLAAQPEFLESRPEAVRRLLRALIRAETFAAANRSEAVSIVAPYIKLDRALVDQVWNEFGFSVSLDQSLLVQMEGQARREIRKMPEASMPDFLKHISAEGLRAVEPSRITIILP
ncbi:MAG: ABC transporter substrate-binding protein [Phaeospirillum sp.]|nr:ABC transporter substrate-binding protein [Phaeospirillum sp.]